jgi:TRAP-type C4-dicarboxylate transport system permease large subunit
MTPRESAQREAEKTYKQFVDMSKRSVIAIILVIIFVGLVSDWETPTNYNGEVYAPRNVGGK